MIEICCKTGATSRKVFGKLVQMKVTHMLVAAQVYVNLTIIIFDTRICLIVQLTSDVQRDIFCERVVKPPDEKFNG